MITLVHKTIIILSFKQFNMTVFVHKTIIILSVKQLHGKEDLNIK